jgi:hypothetical protein
VLQYILKIEGGDGAARATIKQRARVTGAIAARVRKRRPLVIGLATKSRLQCGLAAVGLAVGHLVPMCRLRPPSWPPPVLTLKSLERLHIGRAASSRTSTCRRQ